jgi:hypothetical protein
MMGLSALARNPIRNEYRRIGRGWLCPPSQERQRGTGKKGKGKRGKKRKVAAVSRRSGEQLRRLGDPDGFLHGVLALQADHGNVILLAELLRGLGN